MKTLLLNLIIFIVALIETSFELRLRKVRKLKAQLKRNHVLTQNDALCKGIYGIGKKYNAEASLPKFKPSDFTGGKPQLFTTITTDFVKLSGIFDFKFHVKDTQEYKDGQALHKFFTENEFPPKYNWFDLKGCCLKKAEIEGGKIFDDICFSMIYGFLNFRYITMVKYVERAFQEAFQNQEYVVGEVPLSEEEKEKRMEENDMPFSISQTIHESDNPIYSTKGGKTHRLTEDTHDFLTEDYVKTEFDYIKNLRKRLENSCAISFFIPTQCEEYIRVCPFMFDFGFKNFNVKAKEDELKKADSKSKDIKDDETFYSFNCLEDGYFMVCSNIEQFGSQLQKEIKSGDNTEVIKKINENSDEILAKTLRCLYFGSVTATSDLDFTALTFQSNMVKNYHLQRMVLDNFNHRYQNDMAIAMNGDLENKCYSSGDCLDTNAYMTGFLESKLDAKQFTGIEDVDNVFKSMDNDFEKALEFKEESFFISVALGMTALVDFWEVLEHEKLTDKLELENDVDFSEGILSNFINDRFNEYFFNPMIEPFYKKMEDNEEKFEGFKSKTLKSEEIDEMAKTVATEVKKFVKKVTEYLSEVKKIKNDLNKEIFLDRSLQKFRKSVKLNEGYTILSLIAIEEVSQIQPDFGVAMHKYIQFSLKAGVSLMYANEAYYNNGGIKYQTRNKKKTPPCSTLLEAAYMIFGYDLLHYYELYPVVNPPNEAGGEEPEGYSLFNHGDSLLKLAKYFDRVLDVVMLKCEIYKKKTPFPLFSNDFQEVGFVVDDIEQFGETGEKFKAPEPPKDVKEYESMKDLFVNIKNFRVLASFSKIAMKLKKKYGQNPLELYEKVVKLEGYVLKYFAGYTVGNRTLNIIAVSRLAKYILTSMTFNYLIHTKVWYKFGFYDNFKILSKTLGNRDLLKSLIINKDGSLKGLGINPVGKNDNKNKKLVSSLVKTKTFFFSDTKPTVSSLLFSNLKGENMRFKEKKRKLRRE